jgi:plasmid maintenance system killer protein
MNTVADLTLNISFWSIKKIYNIGYWVLWGTPKSEVEILLEKQSKKMEIMHQELINIHKRLNEIKNTNSLCYESKQNEVNNVVSIDPNQNNSIITKIVNEIEKENLLIFLQDYEIINSKQCEIIS